MRTDRKKKLLLPLAASLLMLLMILEGSPVLQGSGFGAVTAQAAQSNLYSVHVDSGYLALRTAKAYDYSNEIGKLYTGDQVQVTDASDSVYWYVYAPGLGKYGYVNSRYLTAGQRLSGSSERKSLRCIKRNREDVHRRDRLCDRYE